MILQMLATLSCGAMLLLAGAVLAQSLLDYRDDIRAALLRMPVATAAPKPVRVARVRHTRSIRVRSAPLLVPRREAA